MDATTGGVADETFKVIAAPEGRSTWSPAVPTEA